MINLIDKYVNIVLVYGVFLKFLKKSVVKDFEFELFFIIDGNKDGKVYNEDINILIKKIKGDILYLDLLYNVR